MPFPPGGSSDSLARVVAEALRDALPGTVVVENRAGGTTQVGTEIVANAAPDGYTMLQGSATAFAVLPNLRPVPYDAKDGFEFAGGIADYIAIVAVRPDLGFKSLGELVEAARRSPGKYTFGSAGLASAGHIYGGILMKTAGIDVLHVPFKGSGELVPALLGGQIDLIIDGVALGPSRDGRTVPLAVFSDRRHPELPQVPTIAEAGVAARLPEGGWGVMLPRGTPQPIMARMTQALERVVTDPAVAASMLRFGVVARWKAPADYRRGLDEARAYYESLLPSIGLEKRK